MRVVICCGDQPRHHYYANTLAERFNVVGIIHQRRETRLEFPEIEGPDAEMNRRHFDLRAAKEEEYFLPLGEELRAPDATVLEVTRNTLNERPSLELLTEIKPDVVAVYGTHLFGSRLIEAAPEWLINLHGGLSPWYRGSATLFWPVYMMQPGHCGTTLHLIDRHIDSGDILQHSRPEINATDTVHDIGCRAIVAAADAMTGLLRKLESEGTLERFPQKKTGKVFYSYDFRPHHLRVINFLLESGLLAEYVEDPERFDGDLELIDQLSPGTGMS